MLFRKSIVNLALGENSEQVPNCKCRFMTLQIQIQSNCCIKKQVLYHSHLMPSDNKADYELLLKGGVSAQYIPGTVRPLTLKAYREDLGVPYSSLNFWLNYHPLSGECTVCSPY